MTEEVLTGAEQLSDIVGQVRSCSQLHDAFQLATIALLVQRLIVSPLCVQDLSRAMLQQMQHIQHAAGDLTAEELRISTTELLHALKVSSCRAAICKQSQLTNGASQLPSR